METNILQALVQADKKVRDKLKRLQQEYDDFLQNLPSYKIEEEKKFLSQFNQEVEALKKELEEKLSLTKQKIDSMNPPVGIIEKDHINQSIDSLFERVIKAD